MERSSEVYRGKAIARRLGIELPEVDMTRWNLRYPKITYDYGVDNSLQIILEATVRDVETGESGPIISRKLVSLDLLLPGQQVAEMIKQLVRQMLVDMLVHELNECLYVDGERVCKEPHPGTKFLITGITDK